MPRTYLSPQSRRRLLALLAITAALNGCDKAPKAGGEVIAASVPKPAAQQAPVVAQPPATPPAVDGPFGLKMGQTMAELGAVPDGDTPGLYMLKSVPIPHQNFSEYRVLGSDKTGICKIVAMTPSFNSNDFGTPLRGQFSDLQEALEKKYGLATDSIDQASPGSIWRDPRYFHTALEKEERVLKTYWIAAKAKGSKPAFELPYDLAAISIQAIGFEGNRAMIRLAYEFKNAGACIESIKAQADKAL